MRRRLLLLLLVTSIGITERGFAQSDRKIEKELRADIGYLASDSLEGRRTGSEGERKAGDYIQKRYEEIKVPAYKGNYRYPFGFVYGKEIGKNTQLMLNSHVLRLKEEAFPLPFSASKKVHGEVLPDIYESGNIWMMPLYAEKDEADDPHFDAEKFMYEHAKAAMEKGAIGVLFYDPYGSKYAPEYNGQSVITETIDIPVAFLTYKGFMNYGQNTDNKNNNSSAEVIDMNINIKRGDRIGTNIAAYIDNKAPYTVVIGAHYDHLGRGEDGNSLYAGKDAQIHNGADDNASGTAALLVMAEMVKKHRLKHYNYLFVNFSAEELGLLGSKAFIKDQALDSMHIAYMINMDMVGRLNDSTHALEIGGVGTSPAWASIISKPNKNFRISVDSSGVGPSDHTSFYHANIPVLFFFTGTHRDYHKPSDDADKINYKGEVAVIHYVYNVVATMDKQPKPQFHATKQNSIGRVNFKVTLGIMPDYAYQDKGVRIDGVSDGKPASRAGLKEGDIIVQLGEYKVQGMQSYMEALSHFNKGDKTTVKVKRGNKELEMPLQFDK